MEDSRVPVAVQQRRAAVGRAGGGGGGALGLAHEAAGAQDLAAEVRQVRSLAPDRLVDAAQVGERERLGDEARGQGGVLQLGADALQRVGQDARVVERQRHRVRASPFREWPCF
jgi:hypothetical protein